MKLYREDDIMDALNSVPDIKGQAYVELEEKLQELEPAAVIRECYGCMGASYNPKDCAGCNPGEITLNKEIKTSPWIPTKERLPENPRPVIVAIRWPDDDIEISIEEYWGKGEGWGTPIKERVVAWMELPKYEEQ